MDGLPAASKIPLHAGVYYSPQFSGHEQKRVFGSDTWSVAVGAASVKMFDELLAKVFDKTTRVTHLPAGEQRAEGVDLVIAPSLLHFDFRLGGDPDSERYSVAYRITLYTVEGVPVASWVASGNAPPPSMWSIATPGTMVENDMKDAASKFLQAFPREAGPSLAALAARQTGRPSPIDPRQVSLSASRGEFSALEPEVAAALEKAGVLAIHLVAQSSTERGLVVRASDTRLRLKDGRTLEPATISSALSALDQTSHDGTVAAGLLGPLVGALVDISAQRSQQEQRETQYSRVANSLFLDRSLARDKKEAGNIAFRMPADTKPSDVRALTAWVVDPALAEGVLVEIGLQIAP